MLKDLLERYSAKTSKYPHEFCPRCEANLTLQKGYSNQLPYWVCKGCGEMLINPEIDSEVAWICDGCGEMLNIQPGFSEDCGEWTCAECGFVNKIDKSELYVSEDEYQADARNPYKGLSDSDLLALSLYQEVENVGDRTDVIYVRKRDTGRLYVKKLLMTYDKSIYEFLKDNPIDHMPRVIDIFESSNYLIVIEEHIEGRTVSDILDTGVLAEDEAVRIAKSVCRILDKLHNLPTPIVHRDVKPSNIIIDPNGEVFLLDMNVAKWFDEDKTHDTWFLGTQSFAAPEQAGYGLSASSAKSDIYAVGVLMNVMLTNKLPNEERASGRIWDVIEKCISLDAEKRYTAAELINELERIEDAGEADK